MRFSILVPVYNVEAYVKECLESLISQTFKDFEVIIIDDGSTDTSGKICDTYEEKYNFIKVIHKMNQGTLAARESGIKNASGDFCVFVDSDDLVKPELLSVLNDYIKKYKADMVLYSFEYFFENSTTKRNKKLFADGLILEGETKKVLYEKYINTADYNAIWTKCIKTEILKNDPTDYTEYYGLNMAEDVLQSLYPITKAERIVFADKELYLYRYNPESISNKFSPETISKKNSSHVYEAIRSYLPKWGLDNDEHINEVNAAQLSYMIYTFTEYYKSNNKSNRKEIVDFDWCSFLPYEFKPNSLCGKTQTSVYDMICAKDYKGIESFFLKQKIYGKYKSIKKKIKG